MEKYVFLSMLKTSLLQMNVPTNNIVKHVEVFDKYFGGKTPEETKKIIKGIGGIEGALEAIYKIESKRNPDIIKPSEIKKSSVSTDNSFPTEKVPSVRENEPVTDAAPTKSTPSVEVEEIDEISVEKVNESTKEIPTLDDITIDDDVELIFRKKEQPIIQAEKEMEKTTVNDITVLPEDNFEFATELPPLEDEVMAYRHPSRLVEFFKGIRTKMSDEVYKYTLPLTMLLNILGYAVIIALFPILAVVIALSYVLYYVCMIGGGVVSLAALVYGIIKVRSSVAIGLYEIGVGVIIIGITLIVCTFIYLFNKKLMPFLFVKAKEMLGLWTKANKAFFRKSAKGANI